VTGVQELIHANRRLAGCEISAEVGISYGKCQAILTEDLNMRSDSAKFVPCVLTIEQKEHRFSAATNLLQEAETDQNFMEDIITGNRTWVDGYDLETKRQSLHWKLPKSPTLKKARQVRSKMKVMLIVLLFTWKGFFTTNMSPKVKQ
jgi:hypothetical protein